MSRKSEMKAAKKAAYEAQGIRTVRSTPLGKNPTLMFFGAHFNSEDRTRGAGWGFDLPCFKPAAREFATGLLDNAVACHARSLKAYKSEEEYIAFLLEQTKAIAANLDWRYPRGGNIPLDPDDADTRTQLIVFIFNVYALQTMGAIPIDNGNGLNLAYMSEGRAA